MMIIKKNIFIFFTTIPLAMLCNDSLHKFYSTSFLKNHTLVQQELITLGFEKITFTTDDKLALSGLFLSRPDARCNVIICAGWYPGKKEGMATFYALLPTDCNILLFDARGHGESEGLLLWKLWQYGIHEYKDIIGAISYLNTHNNLPIIIAGLCSGAFNAAHAIIALEENNKNLAGKIKGLIFDSGWGSVGDIAATAPTAGLTKRILSFFAYSCKIKTKSLYNSYFHTMVNFCAHLSNSILHFFYNHLLIQRSESITNLFNKIHSINSPILFIHSYDDTYANIHNVIKLTKSVLKKECWLLKKSYHAKHHIIHKEMYQHKLNEFIHKCLE